MFPRVGDAGVEKEGRRPTDVEEGADEGPPWPVDRVFEGMRTTGFSPPNPA